MTMQNNTIKTFITVGAVFAFVFGVFMATPTQAHAFSLGQIIDPGCFVACSNGGGGRSTKTVTNYYNGNYRSPGGTVINGSVTTSAPTPAPAPVYNNNIYNNTYSSSPSPAPVYSYNYNTAPIYTYGSTYSYNQPVITQPVYVQQPAPVVYQQPVYSYAPAYDPLYVSCSANSTYGTIGSPVTWTAYATGGAGYYTYSWNGTDGMYGSGQSTFYNYNTPGYKTASVTVYSNGQSITQICSNSVSIAAPYYQPIAQPIYAQPVPVSTNYNGLDVGCYADPTNAGIEQPVTWNAEVTGGVGPYTYSWTGSNAISGTAATVIKYYSTAGSKNAIVTVTSADGRSATRACSNTVTVRGATAAPVKPVVKPAPVQAAPQANNGNTLSAASLFSLANIPWGWVSVLIILVLFFTVIYLMFNKPKI